VTDVLLLDLNELSIGDIGVTKHFGATLAEAAAVLLETEGHSSGVDMPIVDHDRRRESTLVWAETTDQMRRCWHDLQDATEFGATAVALLLVRKVLNLSAVDRSAKGPGFDYWIGDDTGVPFAKKARLEISGIRRGEEQVVNARIRQKLRQTDKSDGSFPAYVVVVEFGQPVSHLVAKQ
jgi:hypothetical protein